MPHVTLVYPFLTRDLLSDAVPVAQRACECIAPWEVVLRRFDRFEHSHGNYAVWLVPEPEEPFVRLQAALAAPFPQCDAVARFPRGFTPHLSVGQVRATDALQRWLADLASWQHVSFTAREVSVVVRGPPPDDVFRVVTTLTLGGSK